MIVSHKANFIFIKTRKTAGTSIEIALSRFCGEDDVITPISPNDEIIRRLTGGKGPSNYEWRPTQKSVVHVSPRVDKFRFFNHMPAAAIRDEIGVVFWDSYYKFCFVRNPWDVVVSRYFFVYRTDPRPPFAEALRCDRRLLDTNYPLYTIDGRVAVDYCGRFERLTSDLHLIGMRLGFGGALLPLPVAKANFRPRGQDYREYYNSADREIVRTRFAKEIEIFGYEW
jgi:hypothetical protein